MTATTRASGLRGYSSLVRTLGGDPAKLCRECGLSQNVLEDEDALIPHRQYIYLLEHAAAQFGIADFGLRLAATQDIGILGPTAIAMHTSATCPTAV